ncbi:MerR family transcriptional regulator [Nonomuraea gerenzanensis]|uniref:HTH merR-type domain-containing protein n=1 Tax=Nonomuraea gerenzanensis TaxID=93944 RepID=A0A1M4BL96_9ACTN|nr:MerR family transcriptional regulator [Nonomuraea gerenzanensis]UBU10010.1 hypothetical protein LCN96_37415 [Nonomuraea gerenzanensis]SAP16281.1 hypothetical protein BN4615_P10944 [Nonomuraea gerenzanensis]
MARKTARCTCPADGKLVFLGHLKTCPEVADEVHQPAIQLTFQQVIDRGLSLRAVAYWIDRGYLHPITRGRGTAREWPQVELQVADLMRRLCDAGFTPAAASVIARTYAAVPVPMRIGPGLTLTIKDEPPAEGL